MRIIARAIQLGFNPGVFFCVMLSAAIRRRNPRRAASRHRACSRGSLESPVPPACSHILYYAACRFLVGLNAAHQDTVRRNFMSFPSALRANAARSELAPFLSIAHQCRLSFAHFLYQEVDSLINPDAATSPKSANSSLRRNPGISSHLCD
ncbi:hypothetical protein RFM23_24150 [Mesorhizobium abyssinicae]|uniref:Uncharacterized protein n=1 Tax=Mesorhizobium abyssinicae TaxID=1209958 RepID=A0ABU5ATS6_9HYPH|nr:hypothetical protein [Mesorhizobium abyssinicae]MDX8540714.1 hypothetical protein [Mesorhizobium abyssinicae]